MAKCFDVTGYIEPCNTVRQKYTGRALLIMGSSTSGSIQGSNMFSDDGLKVQEINGKTTFEEFVSAWTAAGGKVFPVIIDAQNPFGVTIQCNTDSGRVSYTKTIPVSIPATRDGEAERFIMGLQKGLYSPAEIVLEAFGLDDVLVGHDIFGAYSQVRLDHTSVTRSEYENGGAWTFNIICEEPVPNVICTMSGLYAALDTLNA